MAEGTKLDPAALAARGGPERGATDPMLLPRLRLRMRMLRRARAELDSLGYEEMEVPSLVAEPGTDPHIALFETSYEPMAGGGRPARLYLHSSPELMLKRLLVAGAGAIYRAGPVFRNGEASPQHLPEFLMIEWYRKGGDLRMLRDETAHLVAALFDEASAAGFEPPGLPEQIPALELPQLFEEATGVDPLATFDAPSFAAALESQGLGPFATGSDYADVFAQVQVERLDDHIATRTPCFVQAWPAPIAVLARLDPQDPRVARRVELYIEGKELANGFEELTDPEEQRARFEADLRRRRELGRPLPPMPEDFLESLRQGLPPCAGMALGLDRLVALACGADSLADVIPNVTVNA